MEEVRGWKADARPQAALHPGSVSPSPQRSPLRPSRSAANLRSPTIDRPPLPPLPYDHDPDDLLLPPPPPYEVRRVRSSSALSAAEASSSGSVSGGDQKPASKMKRAFDEMQFKASGLIGKAVESNKHFSVIRHSRGFVVYQGPRTSVSFTILSDAPLPDNRTVWLQQKGHSGAMGMALKAVLSTRDSWIDVTPAQEALVAHVSENEERSMQRDIDRFMSKASGRAKTHAARETHIVRIPAAASDGYYRLVICGGDEAKNAKKVLCECTVFRIASLSTDAAVVRGASLSTMPLELGIKVASTVGSQIVKKYTGVAGAVVQHKAGKFVAKHSVNKAATVALKGYHGVGGSGIQDAVHDSWTRQRAAGPAFVGHYTTGMAVSVIGSDQGPEKPFPLKFEGKISRGSGYSASQLGYPTANLTDVPDQVRTQLLGVFAAWTRILPGKKNIPDGLSPDWHPAIVTIAPPRGAAPSVVVANCVSVHILHDFDNTTFYESRLKVLLMGWLHPAAPLSASAAEVVGQHGLDMDTTLASLGRENWLPDEVISRMKTLKSERSLSDRLDQMTGMVVQGVDRIPLHWAAVRSESGTLRDQSYGVGGIWIRRS